jgi:REP element-mobilizing transposase RayT
VHVTLKVLETVPYLRKQDCWEALRHAFVAGKCSALGFRLVHFSVQGNHLHLICEATNQLALTRGMQGLAVRIARRLNKKLGRSGRVFAQRYHERILRTPTEVRRAIAYVLNNFRHHSRDRLTNDWVDPLSSAPYFDGWRWSPRRWKLPDDRPTRPAETWLLTTGWRRMGLVAPDEIPVGT